MNLYPCPICSRTFIPSTLKKHVRICEKIKQQKRKVFDSKKQRYEGTELALLPQRPEHIRISPPKQTISGPQIITRRLSDTSHQYQPTPMLEKRKEKSPSPARIEKREILPRIIKRNLAPVTDQCPHCERFFGIKAYDR